MKKRNQIILVSLIIIAVIVILIFLINNSELKKLICNTDKTLSDKESSNSEIIGGQRDSHGCLGPAGYSYDEKIQACIRTWELDETQKQAAKIAVEDIGHSDSLTITQVEILDCNGCFSINLTNKEFEEININIENWKVVDKESTGGIILTAEQCTSQGGKLVNIIEGEDCNENEIKIGDILDFITPNICCVKE